jgi:hypothetical protein
LSYNSSHKTFSTHNFDHAIPYSSIDFLLFQKRSKSVGSASQKVSLTQISVKPTQGSGGVPPTKLYVKPRSSFSRKRSKKRWFCFAEGFVSSDLGEADPSGLLLFQKRSKSVGSASQKVSLAQISAKPTQGVWGRAPSKTLR